MRITEITASFGRTMPHPTIGYASIKVDVSATATLDETNDPAEQLEKLTAWIAEKGRRMMITEMRQAREGTDE